MIRRGEGNEKEEENKKKQAVPERSAVGLGLFSMRGGGI